MTPAEAFEYLRRCHEGEVQWVRRHGGPLYSPRLPEVLAALAPLVGARFQPPAELTFWLGAEGDRP